MAAWQLRPIPSTSHEQIIGCDLGAETKAGAETAMDHFKEQYEAKYPSEWERLAKDREVLRSFSSFPAEHWWHIRTTNLIEPTFATIRLRHRRTKGGGTRRTSLAMMFKFGVHAEKRWRRLNGHEKISHLIQANAFIDRIMQQAA